MAGKAGVSLLRSAFLPTAEPATAFDAEAGSAVGTARNWREAHAHANAAQSILTYSRLQQVEFWIPPSSTGLAFA
eukprot:COSAG05_NODE_1370_length_5055_cov_1.930387_2_plen_75_part_00